MNIIRKIKRGGALALAVISLFCLSAVSAHAGQQSQTDTNLLVAASTNTFILYGDVSGSFTNGQAPAGAALINCTASHDVWIECGGIFTNSTANSSNITFRIAGSISATQWTNSYATVTVTVPASTTNYCAGFLFLQNAYPFLGLRAIENPNANSIGGRLGTQYMKVYIKNGI